ncbi:MAG: hypothetical protein WAV20_16905 [Blastocatellia bacterium]
MQPIMIALLFLVSLPGVRHEMQWQEFVSAEGKFSARMPTDPRFNSRVTNTKEGNLLTHIISSTDDNLNEFMVSWTEYQKDTIEHRGTEATFRKVRDALVASNNGRVLTESVISAEGHPAREVKFSTDTRIVTVRFYFVKNRFYQVMAQTRPENTDSGERFFESFKLLPGTLL